jgi:hypothetical protein
MVSSLAYGIFLLGAAVCLIWFVAEFIVRFFGKK